MGWVGWKLWYGNGSVATSREHVWADLPAENVQAVAQYEDRTYQVWKGDPPALVMEHYRRLHHSADYYWLNGDGTIGSGQTGDLPEGLPAHSLKLGKLLPDPQWWAVYEQAEADRQAP